MDNDTSKSLYSLLNLIDFLDTVNFVVLDKEKTDNLRQSIFYLIDNTNCAEAESGKKVKIKPQEEVIDKSNVSEDKIELIRLIPSLFKSKKQFKTKKDILNFVKNDLSMKTNTAWQKKTIDDISGNVIIAILRADQNLYHEMVSTLNKRINTPQDTSKETKTSGKKNGSKTSSKSNSKSSTFSNKWLNFYKNYRDTKDTEK